MAGEISKFLGFMKSTSRPEYNQMLNNKTQLLFGDDNKTVSLTELFKKDKSVFEAYKKLDNEGLSKFEKIISLDGDSFSVSQAEYKTLLTVLDAEELDKDSPMLMDGNFEVNDKSNGIYTLDIEQEITPQYLKLKLSQMSKEEIMQELKQKVSEQLTDGSKNKTGRINTKAVSDNNIAKAIYLIKQYSSATNKLDGDLIEQCFGPTMKNRRNVTKFPDYSYQIWSRSQIVYLLDDERVVSFPVFSTGKEVEIIDKMGTRKFKNGQLQEIKRNNITYVDENGDGYADKKITYGENGEKKVENYPDINEIKKELEHYKGNKAIMWREKIGSRLMYNIQGFKRDENGEPDPICY